MAAVRLKLVHVVGIIVFMAVVMFAALVLHLPLHLPFQKNQLLFGTTGMGMQTTTGTTSIVTATREEDSRRTSKPTVDSFVPMSVPSHLRPAHTSGFPILPSTRGSREPTVGHGNVNTVANNRNFAPNEDQPPSVLIVGGTDGSGTRRVVQILTQLGTTMVSEDPETYDIHADLVGGWPVVAHPLLQKTHSLDYRLSDIPSDLKKSSLAALSAIMKQAERDSHKPQSHTLAVGGVLKKSSQAGAVHVSFGIKAPVSLLFVPLWNEVLPHFKFLHVVRDGRDISFSANQGPVVKFYEDMYSASVARGDTVFPDQAKAIRLWSDWNAQIYDWSTKKLKQQQEQQEKGASYDYFVLHAEDIVDSDVQVRFATMLDLAQWVGSNLSHLEICCLAHSGSEFMGSHDRTNRNEVDAQGVQSRYGKWRKHHDANLIKQIHEVGRKGLSVFGYEPLDHRGVVNSVRRLNSMSDVGDLSLQSDFRCGDDVPEQCPKPPRETLEAVSYQCAGVQGVELAVDFRSQDLTVVNVFNQDPSRCCQECSNNKQCQYFTLNTRTGDCYLKSTMGSRIQSEHTTHLVSGRKQ